MKSHIIPISFVLCTACCVAFCQTINRGRNEGTSQITASNVLGHGNITVYTGASGVVTHKKAELTTPLGGCIGIGDIMQLYGSMGFINVTTVGPMQAHLQVTLPGNNHLRFFGVSLIADLYLSTAIDTTSQTADASKPEYSPYPLASLVVDFDWIARRAKWPVKQYILFSLVDNPQLLFSYNQISVKTGIEWKMIENSLFVDAGLALYNLKNDPPAQNAGYDQYYLWLRPGGRYRIRHKYSVVGSAGITLSRHVNPKSTFDPERIAFSLSCEIPVIAHETNTEAIRTMVLLGKNRKKVQAVRHASDTTTNLIDGMQYLHNLDRDLDVILNGEKQNDSLAIYRKDIEKKMLDIEQLLEKKE